MGKINKRIYIYLLCIYLLALPLGAMNIGALGSALKIIALLPVVIAFFSIKNLHFNRPLKLYFLYIAICGFSVLYSLVVSEAWERYSSLLLLFLLIASSCCFRYTDKDLENLKKALIWSSRISVILCLLFNSFVQGRLYFQNSLFQEDPNYFCAYLAFGTLYAIETLLKPNRLWRKIIAVVELVVYISVALLTGSRGGTIALLAGIVLFVVFSNKKIVNIKTIAIVSIVAAALYIGATFLSEDILVRFTIENVSATGGTGRTRIWENAFILFGKSDLLRKVFGQGVGNTVCAWSHYGILEAHVCHNMFIESLIELGVVGLIAYIAMIFEFIKTAYKYFDKYAFGVISVMFFLSLSTSISTFKPYVNIMLFILCIANRNELLQNNQVAS